MCCAMSCWNCSAPWVVHNTSLLHSLIVVLPTAFCRPLWPELLGWCWIPARICKYVWLTAICTPTKVLHATCKLNLHLEWHRCGILGLYHLLWMPYWACCGFMGCNLPSTDRLSVCSGSTKTMLCGFLGGVHCQLMLSLPHWVPCNHW